MLQWKMDDESVKQKKRIHVNAASVSELISFFHVIILKCASLFFMTAG